MKKYLLIGLALAAFTFTSCSKDDEGVAPAKKPAEKLPAEPVAVATITVSGQNITTFGGTSQMSVNVMPADAAEKNVTWSVDDETVATIDNAGTLTAVIPGTVKVTATAKDASGVTGTKDITVTGDAPLVDTKWYLFSTGGTPVTGCEIDSYVIFSAGELKQFNASLNAAGVCETPASVTGSPYTDNGDGTGEVMGMIVEDFSIIGGTAKIDFGANSGIPKRVYKTR